MFGQPRYRSDWSSFSGNGIEVIVPASYSPNSDTIAYSFQIFSFVADFAQCVKPVLPNLPSGKEVTINNLSWYKGEYDECDMNMCGHYTYYTTYQSDTCYAFESAVETHQQKYAPTSNPIDEQILLTLKIIK